MVVVGNFEYQPSERKNKKLKTIVNGKTIHFGDLRYSHFFDKTGLLDKKFNHMDQNRRDNYLKRSLNIKDKYGRLTYDNPEFANYHAIRVLW